MSNEHDDEQTHSINDGYAMHRLERALQTLIDHDDPMVRARAADKVGRWASVIDGMRSGSLTVGSRTPVADTPAWVTLEVAHGGFATGSYVAEGPLEDDERQLLSELPDNVRGHTDRERLNTYFLTDAGQNRLLTALAAGRCRIDLPEEGALPVLAWLLRADAYAEALELVETLRPLMHRLRFYPRETATPRPPGACVRLRSVSDVAESIRNRRPQAQVEAMNEALSVWNPLFDRLVDLWLETVEGEQPQIDAMDGAGVSVTGGWPAQRFPQGWADRRSSWLKDYRMAAARHRLCSKHRKARSNFARLCTALKRCDGDGNSLSRRDVGWVRRALANTLSKRGAPGSESLDGLRRGQAEVAARPTHTTIGSVVLRRLESYPDDEGIPSLDAVSASVDAHEHERVPAGTSIPASFERKLARALEAPIEELIERNVIGSAEVFATVLPQVSAQVAACGFDDRVLRDIYSMTYTAFRRRRSLLLLNLEHQVSLAELPWVAAVEELRSDSADVRAQARDTLEQAALLALAHFPQSILPNPLVREMAALAERAGLEIPLVEEVAADIFMGTFTAKWSRAGRVASETMASSLYGRYYDLPAGVEYDKGAGGTLAWVRARWNATTAEGFARRCERRAAEAGSGGSFVAQNGAILEQSQILTTHNLASLCYFLELGDQLQTMAPEMVGNIFRWIFRLNAQTPPTYLARLQNTKNTAYAWRQAIFFLSLCERTTQSRVLRELKDLMADAGAFGDRFRPAVVGLLAVFEGDSFDASGRGRRNRHARRLLGWSLGGHWLLAEESNE